MMLRRLVIPVAFLVTLALVPPVGVASATPPGPPEAPAAHPAPTIPQPDTPAPHPTGGSAERQRAPEPKVHRFVDDPSEVGPFAVGRTTLEVADPEREGRTLTVDVWYPSDPAQVVGAERSVFDLYVTTTPSPLAFAETQVSAAGGFPLVVFSHGSGGFRLQSWFLTELLASHGFVVASPDHAGNTALDALFGTTTPFEETARNRPLDVSLVIDELLARNDRPDDRFEGAIDADRVGVIGHSFGGYTALAMASGRGDVAPDPRVKAIVPIAPASGLLSDAELASIEVPMLLISGTSDTTTPIVPNTTRPWDLVSSPRTLRVDIDRAGHASFTDICDLADILLATGLPPELLAAVLSNADDGCVPELLPIEPVQDITNLYTVAFLERTLNGDRRYQPLLTKGYARSQQLPVTVLAGAARPGHPGGGACAGVGEPSAGARDRSPVSAGLLQRCLRLNQVQVIGTHNSYKGPVAPEILALIAAAVGPELASELEYSHVPLTEQLDAQEVRQIELDVFADPEGGLYAERLGLDLAGLPNETPPELHEPGFKVLHIQDLDFNSTCLTFVACLEEVEAWSDANEGHLPIAILVELKDAPIPEPFVVPVPIGGPELDALDAEIRSVFSEAQLLTPDDVRGSRATLESAVLAGGWPTLQEAAGKVMFLMDNGGTSRDLYRSGAPSLEGRVLFTSSTPGEPDAAFVKVNESIDNVASIQELVADGYVVRTRADVPTVEARSGDTTRKDAALASGAQWVSTDYPVPGSSPFSSYFAAIPGGEPARCNPVNTGPRCDDDLLERGVGSSRSAIKGR